MGLFFYEALFPPKAGAELCDYCFAPILGKSHESPGPSLIRAASRKLDGGEEKNFGVGRTF